MHLLCLADGAAPYVATTRVHEEFVHVFVYQNWVVFLAALAAYQRAKVAFALAGGLVFGGGSV